MMGSLSHKPIRRAPHLGVERLERRDVPSTVSISDATASEGGADYRFTDYFVAPNAYGLAAGREVELGPDGKVYVASHDSDAVLILEGGTGRLLGELTTPGGELDGPWGMVFGPDGGLYVSGRWSHNLVRFDVAVGSYNVFLSGDENLGNGMTFGPDGSFYVSCANGPVRRYDGETGAYLGDFVVQGSGGMINPSHIEFGPDGNLYVADDSTSRAIRRYDGQTGAFIDTFIADGSGGLGIPRDIRFTGDGYLRVTDNQGYVYRFSAATGAFVDRLLAGPVGNTNGAAGLAIAASGEWYVSRSTATGLSGSFMARLAPSSFAAFTVSLDAPSTSPISVSFSTANGTAIVGADYLAASGTLDFAPGETSRTILVRTLDDSTVEATETFTVTLTNPVGATIADGQGVGSIFDKTRFYVVNDASTDRTYEYGTTGLAGENYALGSGNAAPRGAASTAAGDKVWVVDANKTVYVYSASGGLLGSWTAGSMHAQAQVEGIATNGSDIWLVDAKQDKVFRYTGAASLVSGSQNAASSFNLNNGNGNPKDLVTDGTSIWVVDDAGTDKVFKYTLSGALLGSWTLTGGGGSPAGITLDPSNAQQHLWVVDNATDRVYQYDNARSRTSGSQSASTTFVLAAGNTNPQGISDPPIISISDNAATEGSQQFTSLGAFVDQNANGNMIRSTGMAYGPDGNLYVGSFNTDEVLRFDRTTGAFLGAFVTAGSGGLDTPAVQGLHFRPDGKLYVLSRDTASVLRFDAITGAFLDVFISPGSGGMLGAKGMTPGPDGNWYVSSSDNNQVLRYSGTTGAFLSAFVSAGIGGLIGPRGLTFGPDGNLYVTSSINHSVLRYNGQTGAFIDAFVPSGSGGLSGPGELLFHNGSLYVASQGTNQALRYNAQTGAFLDVVVPAGQNGLDRPIGLLLDPDNNLLVGSNLEILRYGPSFQAAFSVQLDAPSTTTVTVQFATASGSALSGIDFTATNGALTFAPGETTRTIVVRTLDDTLYEGTENFVVTLSNPAGATISDGQATGTITDNEPVLAQITSTRVNDGAAQRSRVTSLTVAFNTQVSFAGAVADAFDVSRIGGAAIGGFTATASVVNGVSIVTLSNFTGASTQFGSLADGRYTLTALASQIHVGGVPLDGNSDGTPGGDYTFGDAQGLFRFFGDINGDRHVDIADFAVLSNSFNSSTGQTNYLGYLDFNGDGHIDIADFGQFSVRFFTPLP
jgi:hypothetical protein